jgi:hypothetical protein
MAEYTLTLTAAEIDIALNRVTNPDQAPLFNSEELVTSGGVKNYVDTQVSSFGPRISAIESELQNTSTGVSLERTAEFTTKIESYVTVPLSASGQPDYFTNNGNNTFTILEGNYLMWFSFNWKTQLNNVPSSNQLYLQLTTLNGMADFAGIGQFIGYRETYSSVNTALLNATFNNVNQTTTFALQIRDEVNGSAYSVYVKDVVFTILKV